MATNAIETDRSIQIGIHQARRADTTSAGGGNHRSGRFDRLVRRTSSPSRQLIHLNDLADGLEVRRTRCTTPLDENIGQQPIDWQNWDRNKGAP